MAAPSLLDNPQGQGAAFHVYFPVADMGVECPPSPPQRLAGGAESILVVDDDPAIADIIQQSLASLGYRVVTRTASTDALALFREDPARFDLVITRPDHAPPFRRQIDREDSCPAKGCSRYPLHRL